MDLVRRDSWILEAGTEVEAREDVQEKMQEDDVEMRPDWLPDPDGWDMEVKRGEDGASYQYYVSRVSGSKFRMKAEVLDYLFSEMDEHWIQSKKSAAHSSMLSKAHEWLPKGWVVEIRAGGENMDKMFKFYVHHAMGVRVHSKEDVLLYVREMKITECGTDGQCDTNSKNNILAEVEFSPDAFPQGWVKEVVYRKTKNGIRKDPYYTDPVSRYGFRTKRAALRFLQTGEVTKRQFIQKTSLHDLYSFEKSADLHKSLRKRLENNWKGAKILISSPRSRGLALRKEINNNGPTSYSTEDTDIETSMDSFSSNEDQNINDKSMKTTRGEPSSSKTIKRPRGRPPKVAKTNGTQGRLGQKENSNNTRAD